MATLTACDLTSPPPGPHMTIVLERSEASVSTADAIAPIFTVNVPINFTITRNGVEGPISVRVDAASLLSTPPFILIDPSESITTQTRVGVSRWAPAGAHQAFVVATAAGDSISVPFTVHVRPFSISLVTRRVALSQGATQKVSLWIRAGGSIPTLQVSGLPAGVALTQTTTLLALTAAADAPTQTAQVTVTATAGSYSESHQLELVVQTPRPKRPIAFRICWNRFTPPGALPQMFGDGEVFYANDGEGWVAVTPDADDRIQFDATERVSLAFRLDYSHQYGEGPLTRVIHATATELEQMQCARATGTESYAADVQNDYSHSLALGAFRSAAAPGSSAPFSTAGRAGVGSRDLVGAGVRIQNSQFERVVVVRRGVDLANGETVQLDLADNEAVLVDSGTYTDTPEARVISTITRLHTTTTVGSLSGILAASGKYWSVPESLLAPSDMQSVMFRRTTAQTTLGALHYFRTVAPLTATFGPTVSVPTVDTVSNTVTLAVQAEYPDVAGVGQRSTLDVRGIYSDVEVWQTRGFLGGTPTAWTFASPDLGGFYAGSRPWHSELTSAGAAAVVGASPAIFFGGSPPAGTRVTWSVTNQYGLMALSLPFPVDR